MHIGARFNAHLQKSFPDSVAAVLPIEVGCDIHSIPTTSAIESDEAIMALIDDVDAETAAKTDCGDELGMREGAQLRV